MIAFEQDILALLHALGYALEGMSREHMVALFLDEARKWGLTPGELRMIVQGGPPTPPLSVAPQPALAAKAA